MSPRPARKVRAIATPVQLTPQEIAFVRGLVIYEDPAVLVLNKPPGLSSQGGRAQVNTLDELLWAFARAGGARPRLIHRLDRDTSGVILTARTKPAAGFLGKAMMARRFVKTYVALAGGRLAAQGVIDVPVRREEIGREAYMRVCLPDHPDAETALTRYRVLTQGDDAALVELKPQTGRMHQLRVHLAHLGCPILGDVRYGGALTLGGRPARRLMLHAAALQFPHPDGGEKRVEAPWPSDLQMLAALLPLLREERPYSPGAVACHRQGVNGARQLVLQCGVHLALPLQPSHAAEALGYDLDGEMAFAAAVRACVPRVLVAVVHHVQPLGREGGLQLFPHRFGHARHIRSVNA